VRLLTAYGLGALLVSVPIDTLAPGSAPDLARERALAVVVAGDGVGFVLDRTGDLVRVAGDGSVSRAASLPRYSTPFGTSVAGRVVFGGIRCDGSGCEHRIAEVTVLDGRGRHERTVTLRQSSGWPSGLDGAALVGAEGDTLWVNADGLLTQVDVVRGRILDEVPWTGGEPCLVDGDLYDLTADATAAPHGNGSPTSTTFSLRLLRWDGSAWAPVEGGDTSMPYGRNAHCAPGGYETRGGDSTVARWSPGEGGWQSVGAGRPASLAWATTSTGSRYSVGDDGSLLVAGGDGPHATGLVVPGVEVGRMPTALQIDDSGGSLFWCATSYREGGGVTSCAVELVPAARAATGAAAVAPAPMASPPQGVHHYNLCSAACGDGVRAHSRDVVAWFVEHERPEALSLNEACYDDVAHLTGRLPGYRAAAGYVALGTTTNCSGAVKQFGNVVMVDAGLEPRLATWDEFTAQTAVPCDRRHHECRGMACAVGGLGEQRRVYCSTHLESPRRGPTVATRQVVEYMGRAVERYGADVDKVLAGDFNLGRAASEELLAEQGYRSLTTRPTSSAHRPPASDQIDAIYHVSSGARQATDATYCDMQASDHCYVTASDL